jgi:hypothetical protein
MDREGKTTPAPDVESLFLLGAGRLNRGLERIQLASGARVHAGRMAGFLAAITWLPLLVLAAVEGLAWGDTVQVPLVKDFLPYGQLLLAVPVLVLAEVTVRKHVVQAVAELRRSEVLAPESAPLLEGLLGRVIERWRGRTVAVVLLVVTCAFTVLSLLQAQDWLTGGWQLSGGRLTAPGWWYLLVSLPVMRFLALRWLWRLALWAWMLGKVARLALRPQAAHPDRAGGLAFLGNTQAAFGALAFAFGAQLSCLIADAVQYRGADLMAFKAQAAAFVAIAVLVLLLPLLTFAPKLSAAREHGLLFLSGRGHRGAAHLDRLLREGATGELPSSGVSALCDFGALYENARLMRPLPLLPRHVMQMALAAALPFLPLVFLVMPVQEVLQTLSKLLV